MLHRISRAFIWLAACAAAAALLGPSQDGTWLTVTAGLALLLAYGLWRAAVWQLRRARDGEPAPSTHLGEAALLDIAVLSAHCCAAATTPSEAVEGVARVLKSELGARAARGRLLPPAAHAASIHPMRPAPAIVIEVCFDDRPVAVVELSDMALAVAPNALNGLLDLVRAQLAEAFRRMGRMTQPDDACSPGPARTELGQAPPDVTFSHTDGGTPRCHTGRDILVVEDNEVNREIVGQMLERLDGIAAQHEFRRGAIGRYRFMTEPDTPEVAVTAHARGGDERRLIEIYFDDPLSEPFRQSQLTAMLNRTLKPAHAPIADDAAPAGAPRPAAAPPSAVLDAQALERLRELDPNGANQLLERVFKAFEASVARLLPPLQAALASGDSAGVRHVAHTLKSSTASIGALKLSQQCADIETAIRLGSVGDLDGRVHAMTAEIEVVLQEVRRVMGEKS